MTATGKISLEQLAKDITECKKVIQRVCLPILEEAELFINEVNEPVVVELIQGYTAEQWQEIIDGGYLCEFGDSSGNWYPGKQLLKATTSGENYPFSVENGGTYRFCRPAQIKGVMRPIFVEPVDKESTCVCLSCDDIIVFSGRHYQLTPEDEATKYIEL